MKYIDLIVEINGLNIRFSDVKTFFPILFSNFFKKFIKKYFSFC